VTRLNPTTYEDTKISMRQDQRVVDVFDTSMVVEDIIIGSSNISSFPTSSLGILAFVTWLSVASELEELSALR